MFGPVIRLVALFVLSFAACLPCAAQFPSWSGLFGDDSDKPQQVSPNQESGTPEWWRRYQKTALFVPGEGYKVEGFDGYFDSKGRPIDAPVDEIGVKLTHELNTGGGLIPGLDPKSAAVKVRNAIGKGHNQILAERYLQEGVIQFQGKRYDNAAASFNAAASRWPGTDLEAKALFNLAESYYFAEQYEKGANAYIALLTKHPSTPRLNDSVERLWGIAQYWEKMHFEVGSSMPLDFNLTIKTRPLTDTIGHAIRLYEAIRLNDPTGPRADDAIMATAGIHFREENFYDADYHYGLLRKEYPRSEHQFEAHLLGLQAKLRKYRGADYDGSPLKEAKKLEERIRLTFSGQLNDQEKTRLRDVRAQLAASVEERDIRMVAYYEGTKHYGAASVYLTKIIEDYPESPAAERARIKLAELQGKEAVPPTKMAWFVDSFPESKRRAAMSAILEKSPTGLTPDSDVTRVAEETSKDTTTR